MKQSDERVAILGQKCEGPTNSFGVFFFVTDKLILHELFVIIILSKSLFHPSNHILYLKYH